MASSLPRIAVRMWLWAAVLRILKRVVPLERLVRMMRRAPRASRAAWNPAGPIESYMNMTGRFPFRPPSNCLERSLVAYRMLCEASADPQLVIGVRHSGDRNVDGHVWVTVGGRALGERPASLSTYTPLARFDARGHLLPPEGPSHRAAAESSALASGLQFD